MTQLEVPQPAPYRLDGHTPCQQVPALGVDVPATVAGRLRRRRDLGGVVFADLEDQGGRIQVFTEDVAIGDDLRRCVIGDWIAVDGTAARTRRGAPSLRATMVTVLASTRRPFPDTWRGLGDQDTRWRRRYVDLWANADSRRVLTARSLVISTIRRTLEADDFIEVETPILQHLAGGANARPFITHHNALGCDLSLRIAPELFLKRLVVGGFERVFEIGRVFRNEGISPRHNPEFTMLEIYQAYADYTDMMSLTEQLVVACATAVTGGTTVSSGGVDIDLAPPWPRVTMEDAVEQYTGRRIRVDDPVPAAALIANDLGVEIDDSWTSGRILAQVFDRVVDGQLVGPVFITDHPVETSPLARPHRSRHGVTERFEAFVLGSELANAFSELTDPEVQRERFREQVGERAGGNDEAMPYDADFVRALEYGLPPTGGLGIGTDRLVMLVTGAESIREVIAFPTLAPEQLSRSTASREQDDGGAFDDRMG